MARPHVLFFQLLQTFLKDHLLIKDFLRLTFKTFLLLMIEHRTLCMCAFVFECACVCRCTFVGVYAVAQTCDRPILTSCVVVPQVPSPLFLKQGLSLTWSSPVTLSWLSMVCQGFWHKPPFWVCLSGFWGWSSSPHTCKTSTLLTELSPQLGIYYFPLDFFPL